MKAINDYRILMPNVPYYETGILFNEFEIVYYTGINAGTYTDPNTFPSPKTETVVNPIAGKTGYYYLSSQRFFTASQNVFWTRPDSPDNVIYDSSPSFIVEGKNDFTVWTQDFFFKPTYGSKISFSANFYENEFQDNYRYILGKSENVIQVEVELNFQGITDNEARALNHFYQNHYTKPSLPDGQGMRPVEMSLFYPHEKVRPYYLKTINNNLENVDFNTVSLSLESPFISITSWQEKLIPFTTKNVYFDTVTYGKHDYVFPFRLSKSSDGFFYYTGDTTSTNVNPYSTDVNNHWTQKFYFSPDLAQSLNFDSTKYKNDLSSFYLYQNVGINPNSFNFDLQFNNRSDKEAQAILHFLENHNGVELFQYDVFTPYTGTRSFYCPEWSHTFNFKDNHSIQAKFIESKFDYSFDRTFNTTLIPSSVNFGFVPLGFTKTQEVKIRNQERKPITFIFGADEFFPILNNTDVSFVDLTDPSNTQEVAPAGGFATYDLLCKVSLKTKDISFSTVNFLYTGRRAISQENENLGIISEADLLLNYSGKYFDDGQNIPDKFLSGLKTCVVAPYYDFGLNKLCLQTKFTIPESGFYYTDFSGRLTTTSGDFSAGLFTGSSKAVVRNDSTQLYDIGTPDESFFTMNFTGIQLGTDYFVRVSGYNYDYLGKNSGDFVFASGIDRLNSSMTNPQVISGLTLENLQTFGINPPSIRIDGIVEQFIINGPDQNCFDLYKYVESNARFGTAFALYSGIKIDFNNVTYGPLTSNSVDDCFDIGAFIITGDYSSMPSGVVLNFYNSKIIGKGGNTVKTNTNSARLGKNGFYINCSGVININKDGPSIFAGGGGAGDTISFTDVVDKPVSSNKFNKFLPSITPAPVTKDVSDFVGYFNKIEQDKNKNHVLTKGSAILYDFFNTAIADPYLVYGGAGAGMGKGTGVYLGKTFVQDATRLNSSNNYELKAVIEYQKSKYIIKQGK